MNKQQFSKALEVAKSPVDLSRVDDSILYGCGLPDFDPVHCTIDSVAKLIRWQCFYLNGGIDSQELDSLAIIARRKFLVLD